MARLSPISYSRSVDTDGTPRYATLTTLVAGGTTNLETYQDADATTPHANPIETDSYGIMPAVYLQNASYKFVLRLYTSSGGTLLQTITTDNVDDGLIGGLNANTFASYGAVGDGVTDDTTIVQDCLDLGGSWFVDKTYAVAGLDLTVPVELTFGGSGKLFQTTGDTSTLFFQIDSAASGSVFRNLTLDCNRTARAAAGRALCTALRVTDDADDLKFHGVTSIKNVHGRPCYMTQHKRLFADYIYFENVGGSFAIDDGYDDDIGAIVGRTCITGSNGLASDMFKYAGNNHCRIDRLLLDDLTGDTASGSVAQQFCTLARNEYCKFGDFVAMNPDNTLIKSHGFSIVSNPNCTWDHLYAFGCSKGVEWSGNQNAIVNGAVCDGNYNNNESVSGATLASMVGWDSKGYEDYGQISGDRARTGARRSVIANLTSIRSGKGIETIGGNDIYVNLLAEGNYYDGISFSQGDNAVNFPGAPVPISPTFCTTFRGATIRGNGRAGVLVDYAHYAEFHDCAVYDNGQVTSNSDAARSGFRFTGDSSGEVTSLLIASPDFRSRLKWPQVTNGISIKAASTDADNRVLVAMNTPLEVFLGASLALVGVNASGGGNVAGRVVSLVGDLITLDCGSAYTFAPTEAALTGTWDISANGTTMTGTGGDAEAEITGPMWVKNASNSEWALIIDVNNDDSIRSHPDYPFATGSQSGVTLNSALNDVTSVPRQIYNMYGATANHCDNLVVRNYLGGGGTAILKEMAVHQDNFGYESDIILDTTTTLATGGDTTTITDITREIWITRIRANVTTAIAGLGQSAVLNVVIGGTTVASFGSATAGGAIAKNTKIERMCGISTDAGGDDVTIVITGGSGSDNTPSAGAVRVEILGRTAPAALNSA